MGKREALSILADPAMLAALRAERARRPQPGPQETFLKTDADIAIYGGAAGSGKTYAMLIAPLQHIHVPGFSCVTFRRETPQIRNPGGLWDESVPLYKPLGSEPLSSTLTHRFPSGAVTKFSHLERDDTVFDWDGAQVPMICFDQLEHFTHKQFFYMLSRNRSACGVKPTIKATCNPNADSWLAKFLAWWIDQETGLPIKARAGLLRWMVRVGDSTLWYDSRQEAFDANVVPGLPLDAPEQPIPMSVTFIPGTVYDNKKLLSVNPQYLANLKALSLVERERLLGGNWKVRAAAGLMFRREWCPTIDALPNDIDVVRYWDRAATPKTDDNDPDMSVGIKMARQRSTGQYILVAATYGFYSPQVGEAAISNTAQADGKSVRIGIPQDPGQAGKSQAQATVRMNDGYSISYKIESGDKVTRFSPFSAQAEAGNVSILRGFDEEILRQLEAFPDGRYKDAADACSGAYEMFHTMSQQGLLAWMQQEIAERDAQRKSA